MLLVNFRYIVIIFIGITCLFSFLSSTSESFQWCDGDLTFETDRWGYNNGIWMVYNWFYHRDDTHVFALRTDGSTTHSTANVYSICPSFTSINYSSDDILDFAIVEFEAPAGKVSQSFKGISGSCCSLSIVITVENTDSVPHFYEWREYHDMGFAEKDTLCAVTPPPTTTPLPKELITDGGRVCLGNMSNCYYTERHLENIPCDIGFMFWNPDEDIPACSFQFTGDNLPYDVEVLDWSSGLFPCLRWSGLTAGNPIGGCDDDDSLLMIWRIPERGTLMPGEKASVSFMISNGCLQPCTYPTPVISPPVEFTPTPTPTKSYTAILPSRNGSFLIMIFVILTLIMILSQSRRISN